jgi:hypothetical protein
MSNHEAKDQAAHMTLAISPVSAPGTSRPGRCPRWRPTSPVRGVAAPS